LNRPISLEQLRDYCVQQSAEPAEPHTPFVVAHRTEAADRIVVIWTTKHLLSAQRQWKTLAIDGTYKINTLNWPILVSLDLI
jgi:hypothetical protein